MEHALANYNRVVSKVFFFDNSIAIILKILMLLILISLVLWIIVRAKDNDKGVVPYIASLIKREDSFDFDISYLSNQERGILLSTCIMVVFLVLGGMYSFFANPSEKITQLGYAKMSVYEEVVRAELNENLVSEVKYSYLSLPTPLQEGVFTVNVEINGAQGSTPILILKDSKGYKSGLYQLERGSIWGLVYDSNTHKGFRSLGVYQDTTGKRHLMDTPFIYIME